LALHWRFSEFAPKLHILKSNFRGNWTEGHQISMRCSWIIS